MHLTPWSHHVAREGFVLRGWRTPPSGKPLLHFLHGNGFCGRTYETLLQPLAAHFDLWLSDVQGHGDSDHGGRFVGWNRCADLAMEAFAAHLADYEGVPCYAAGHSFGGVLTCLAMADHPRRFQRAVVLDPVLFPPMMALGMTIADTMGVAARAPLAVSARRRRHHWPSRQAAYDALHGRGTYAGWTEGSLHAFVQHALRDAADGGVELKCVPSREAEIFSSAPIGLWGALRRVRTPTLLLHGARTFPFVLTSAAQWARTNEHVSVEERAGGHCFMLQHPGETAQRIRRFLLEGD